MKERSFILVKQQEKTALGYTTGSCAAAAAGAAAQMLATGCDVPYVYLLTPKGIGLYLEVEHVSRTDGSVTCAVQKDGGADSDVTDGVYVYATVCRTKTGTVTIDGGRGVGRVTQPGLDQSVGSAAINHVPRQMIEAAVKKYLPSADVIISIPDGAQLAEKTFNPKLGIVGGISVLGTSGIVEPMSERAIVDTIRVELHVRHAQNYPIVPVAPGNYGRDFMKSQYGFSIDAAVSCSNFVAECIALAAEEGFTRMLFIGHIGKLVKVAGGIRNTHSKYGDRRMEILTDIARAYCPADEFESLQKSLGGCVSTDEAVRILEEYGIKEQVLSDMTGRIQDNMIAWSSGKIQVEVVVFSNVHGVLGMTGNADLYMKELQGGW